MKDIPRLFPLWLILFIVIIFAMCGCRTGGTRLNPNSAGTIIRTSDVRPNFTPLPPVPIAPPVSNPIVLTNAVRSTPVLPEPSPAKANPVIITPEPAGEATPFEPTVSSTQPTLPELETTKLPLPSKKAGDGGCIIAGDIAGPCEAAPEEEEGSLSTNWVGLFSFFMMCLLGAIGLWVIYDLITDSIQMRKKGTPIKDHLKGLKKPAKGTGASRKKATNKKKATRKKKS